MTGILGLVTGALCFLMFCTLLVVIVVTHVMKHAKRGDAHVELVETAEPELN